MKTTLLPMMGIVLGVFVGCSQDAASTLENKSPAVASEHSSESTEPTDVPLTIAQELRQLAESNNTEMWTKSRLRAESIEAKLPEIASSGKRVSMLFQASMERLNSGDVEIAIQGLEGILKTIKDESLAVDIDQLDSIRELLGIAYLRKGEIENCIANHNCCSCLIPIEQSGQHTRPEGAQKALAIFESLMNDNQYNYQAKWLLNLCHMTLGGYPDKIDEKFLIAPKAFESDSELPRFENRAPQLGIAVADISGSVIMDDFNNDGWLDLVVSSYGLNDQLHYFQNDGTGGFRDQTESAGLKGQLGGLNMIQADYNNDGFVDVLVLRGGWFGLHGQHPNSLLRNNGDDTFTDVAKESGLLCRFPTQTAVWADFDNDGWIDLFIGNEHSKSLSAPTQLFRNNGDGTFTDEADSRGARFERYVKGCVASDFDNDGDMDIYLSCLNSDNLLLMNQSDTSKSSEFKFKDVAIQSGTAGPKNSFPCWFFDYNQDGREDLFVSGFDIKFFATAAAEVAKEYDGKSSSAVKPKLYRNNGDGTFTDATVEAGVSKVLFTMGCNFGDLNNDGFPDFYCGTGTPDFRAIIPNRMFLNTQGNSFKDVTKAGGFGHLQKGHGIAFGDFDNDGDQDIYNVLGGAYDGDNFMNAMFVNPGNSNHYLKLKLVGTNCNRSAIGAKVTITAKSAEGESRQFHSRVNSGGSFGANPLNVEVGLQDCNSIENVVVTWPGRNTPQTYTGFEIDTSYRIVEGQSPELYPSN